MYDLPGLEVLFTTEQPCPYLPHERACFPLTLAPVPTSAAMLDRFLDAGHRRSGEFFYRPRCAACRACQPLRIDVERFRPRATQRRIWNRGRRLFRVEIGMPEVSAERVRLFNAHRLGRGLGQEAIDEAEYAELLIPSPCDTLEMRYYLEDRLTAVALCDRGESSLSAVYCYFDPRHAAQSPGAFSILTQIDLCRQWGLRHLYLGLYVAACPHLSYKAQYRPHERYIDGAWVAFS